jgi:hypothetical protein
MISGMNLTLLDVISAIHFLLLVTVTKGNRTETRQIGLKIITGIHTALKVKVKVKQSYCRPELA